MGVSVANPPALGAASSLIAETMRRQEVSSNAITGGTQVLRLGFFTQQRTGTITKIGVVSGATAATATISLVRFGLYTESPADLGLTLVAATTNDAPTTTMTTQNTAYEKSLGTGGGLPASYTLEAGQRYALAFLIVTSGTANSLRGNFSNVAATNLLEPKSGGQVSGQSDLPTTIASASVTGSSGIPHIYGLA